MPRTSHRVGKIDLDVGIASMTAALALRAQIEQLGWHGFPAAIERVLDRLETADRLVRIDRLVIDLGDIRSDALESGLTAAFETALERGLRELLDNAGADGGGVRTQAVAAALLDEFIHYLRTGTVAARAAAAAFDPAAILWRLIAEQPEALAALLQRHAGEPHVMARLVAHGGAAGLQALLAVLAPDHALLILAYLDDFQRHHRHAVAIPMAAPALQRALWALTITYLLHEAGTQFNRRSYLATLIAGVARAESLGYAVLLARMQVVAARTRASQPLAGSMLAMLDALLLDIGGEAAEGAGPAAGATGSADAYASAEAGEPGPLLTLLRRSAAHPIAMDALLRPMSAGLFAGLIARLQPQHGGLIVAYVEDLVALHERQPLAGQSTDRFERQLRMLALRYLLHDAGTQFNRLAWLRRLLSELAASTGVTYRFLLLSFAGVLAGLRTRMPLSSSLPEGLALLTGELDQTEPAYPPAGAADPGQAGLLARLGAGADLHAVLDALRTCTAAQFAELIAALAPQHAMAIEADIARLIRAEGAWRESGVPAFSQRIAGAGLRALLADAHRPFERRRWLQALLTSLDETAAPPYRALATALAREADRSGAGADLHTLVAALDAAQAQPAPQDSLAMAERFLRTGQPQYMGARLPALAAANPDGFAMLARRCLSAASGASATLINRMLIWMLPDEIMRALLADGAEAARRRAEMLADQPGASMAEAWRHVIDGALRGTLPEGGLDARGPALRLDRLAALRHLLDHGALPWWAPAGMDAASLPASLSHASAAMLHDLLFDPVPERLLARLRAALSHLDPEAGQALLARLAPQIADALPPAGLDGLAGAAPSSTSASGHAAHAGVRPPAAAREMAARLTGRQALFDWLAGHTGSAAPDGDGLRLLAALLDRSEPVLDAMLGPALAIHANRLRWAPVLPDEILARLLHKLAPSQARFMLDLKMVLQAAGRQSATAAVRDGAGVRLAQALLDAVAQPSPPPARALAAQLLDRLCAPAPASAAGVRARARALARRGGHANIAAAMQTESREAAGPPARPPRAHAAEPETSTLYIANAGLVLLHPFLPMLFKHLGILDKDAPGFDAARDLEQRMRAAYLLQRLVDERPDPPEPALALNKILCGIPLATPLVNDGAPDDTEAVLGGRLLHGMIGNWSAVRTSSPQAIRETFLQRDGRLVLTDGQWHLTVTRKTVDVLVDLLQWAISVILHPWMPNKLTVTW